MGRRPMPWFAWNEPCWSATILMWSFAAAIVGFLVWVGVAYGR